MFNTIVWATDASEEADRALPTALALAREAGAKLLVVHADERIRGRAAGMPLLGDELDVQLALEAKVRDLVESGVDAELYVVRGLGREPADLVAEAASERGADVIVVGTRGHGRLAGMMLGSVTQRLLHVAPCPVLAVPARVAAHAVPASA